MVQRLDPSFVQRELRAELVQTYSGESFAAAKGRERLTEDGVLLALELCQKRRDRRIVRLIDAAARNQLVNQILDVLPSHGRKRTGRNVEQVELVGNVQ